MTAPALTRQPPLQLAAFGMIADPGETGHGHLAMLVDSIRRDPSGLRRHLSSVRHGSGGQADLDRSALARRSYLHPNGFAKIVLGPGPLTDTVYRVHVWDDATTDEPRGETEPHGHRWPFASTVIFGDGLSVASFTEIDCPRDDVWFRYEYDRSTPDAMRLVEQFGLQRDKHEDLTRKVGDIYRCDTKTVHTIEPMSRAATATFVVQGRDRSCSAPIYRRAMDATVVPRRHLSTEELTHFIDVILARLR